MSHFPTPGRARCWRRGWPLALALIAGLTGRAAAQDEAVPWKDSFYPYFPSLGNNFPLIAIHFEERKAADYFARTPYAGLISLDLGTGFTGARMAVARLHTPLLVPHWRLAASLGTTRESRLGYYGLGNTTEFNENLVTESQPHYYEARRTRYFGNLELSRQLVGPLFLSAAGGIEHSNFGDLSGPSLFRTDFGTADLTADDVRGRIGLVLDWRDNEFNTANGIFLQASYGGGTGGDHYSRTSADVRAYLSPREGTVLAARVLGSSMSSSASLSTRFEVPLWENETSVLGGTTSHRGLAFQRLAGRGVLVASAEVRYDLLNLGDFGAFTLLGFFDAGRVFEEESFELTTRDMKAGGGGGLAIRIMRMTIWTFNFGTGPDGFQFSAGTGWAY